MQNNNSYNKLLKYSIVLILSVIVILGIVIIGISSSVYKKTELERLKNTGCIFINIIQEEYTKNNSPDTDRRDRIRRIFSDEYGTDIDIYDSDGKYMLSYRQDSRKPLILKSIIDDGQYLKLSSDGISSEEPYLIYGDTFSVNTNGSTQKMYIFAYSDTHNISMFTMNVFIVYLLASVIIMIVAFILMKKKTRIYADYNNDIIRILKKYSKGDFSEKIKSDNILFPDEKAEYINKLASDIESSEETSKTFIANVSHELRTPITTIGGFVDGILDGTIPKSKRNEYLILVSNEIQRLKVLISSMLNMSRFESGTLKPHFQNTNLIDLVMKTAFMFEKKIEAKNVEVEDFDAENLFAEIDPDLIQQVVYNIIENAVKFVNTGGKLSFRFEKDGNMCIIGIRNTGEGLKDNEIPQVFDRFYKTDSSRGKDTTGLGLGLSISRKIVHINNGHIVVRSVYGEYTEFQIQLPEKQQNL